MKVHQMLDLTGKVAIVTGGWAFLGYDMAEALAEYGADIIITSRTLDKAKRACEKLHQDYGVDTLALAMDQTDYAQVQAMAQAANAWKGHIDILINNAGGGSGQSNGNLFERDVADIVSLMNTNLMGSLYCCREVGRYMVARHSGKIINMGSIAGIVGRDREMYYKSDKNEQPIDYAASKAGVIGMTRDLAGLMSPQGVCVNSISPGGFDKGDIPPEFVRRYGQETMLGHMGRMGRDIKGAALFLASGASDYVTGHNLVVDGGFSVWK